jgi:hypothetical protein
MIAHTACIFNILFELVVMPVLPGFKLKQAGQSAGDNIADAAGKVGSVVKSRWAVFQEARQRRPPGETVQERFITAAATTSVLLRKGISETKEKVAVGKVKVEEVCLRFNTTFFFTCIFNCCEVVAIVYFCSNHCTRQLLDCGHSLF